MGPTMILLLGAMTLVGPDRPGALLGTASAETYSAWLAKTAIETEDMANGAGSEVCASAAAKSLGWRATEDPYLAPIVARYGTASIIEKVRVTGCGRDHVQTLVVYRSEGSRFAVVRLAQGESIAPIRPTWDATHVVAEQAWSVADRYGCSTEDSLRMGETHLLSPVRDGEWTELWPLTVCGAPQAFAVTFKMKSPDNVEFRVERRQ
ncbi:hypothetical protein GCM10010983_16300 [Caulobacter rhizosphaerae]|jgi:hypothetical protein|nr:hypothetical protein ASD47_20970 [Caulobacter sp. Root1472]GGL19776.1 hypothetical protein GCM10010983_16300 [Caulobacter rhizosphaerae]